LLCTLRSRLQQGLLYMGMGMVSSDFLPPNRTRQGTGLAWQPEPAECSGESCEPYTGY
jgi:hypothetical protein